MKYLFIVITILVVKEPTSLISLQHRTPLNTTTLNKRDSVPNLKSGFYLAVKDTTKSNGFKVYNAEKYYYLSPSPIVDLGQVDSVYKEHDGNLDKYILHFRFNQIGSKIWFDFTTKHMGSDAAIVLGNKVIWAATITEPMDFTYLVGKYTSGQIDSFQIEVIKEIQSREAK
jgi:preprotein translocase subunit SecD